MHIDFVVWRGQICDHKPLTTDISLAFKELRGDQDGQDSNGSELEALLKIKLASVIERVSLSNIGGS